MNTVRITAIASSILLAASSFYATASAQTETVKVKVYPYELATIEGRTSALDRIQRAATQLCTPATPLYSRSAEKRCEKQTTEQMVRQTQSPALYAMWSRKGAIETASRN